ncbi:MAG: gamma-glutamyltransferase [Candidatus Actinomarina sp.]|nr:gamma-glutamyltransferase [Candidatus Actinomarina sp.]
MSSIVVSPHHLSTKAGKNILEMGGNAIDAAIAVNIVQGIVAPETCGIGGDLFALIWKDGFSEPECLDASGYAGSNVNGEIIASDNIPLNHPMSVTVPGAVDGWFKLHEKFGSLEISKIFAMGIEICHEGFEINHELAKSLETHQSELGAQLSSVSFYKNSLPLRSGEHVRRVNLGKTLELIANEGPDIFYRGEIAQSISRVVGENLTLKDLNDYSSQWIKPLRLNIFGYDGWTTPPSTQSYLTLSTLKGYELLSEKYDESLHMLIESYRIFAADRDNLTYDYQDDINNFKGVNLDYIEEKIELYDNSKSQRFSFPEPKGGGTAYMTVRDSEGLGISLIQSNFHGIGSRIGVDSYGFFLHNRGCGFNLKKGHPNYLQAGKKPLHTLSPTLWTKENKLELILGTRGGRYQPQLLAQMILPYLQNKTSIKETMSKGRWALNDFLSDTDSHITVEGAFNQSDIEHLKTRGHKVTQIKEIFDKAYGPVSAIYQDKDNGWLGAEDIRVGTEAVETL